MSKAFQVIKLGKDSYSVMSAADKPGFVVYRKLGEDGKGYLVGFADNGMLTCSCPGFRYHSQCKHTLNFEEIGNAFPEVVIREKAVVEEGKIKAELLDSLVGYVKNTLEIVGLKTVVAGSFRRAAAGVKDLDFVTVATQEQVMDLLIANAEALTVSGEQVIRFQAPYFIDEENNLTGTVQVDLCLTTEESFGAAFLYLTGSKEFNIFMRSRAKSLGLRLSRHDLIDRNTEQVIASATEQEIFQALGMDFVPPAARDNNAWLSYVKGDLP